MSTCLFDLGENDGIDRWIVGLVSCQMQIEEFDGADLSALNQLCEFQCRPEWQIIHNVLRIVGLSEGAVQQVRYPNPDQRIADRTGPL